MSDGTVPVHEQCEIEGGCNHDVTSDTPAKEDSRTIKLGLEENFIYTVWRMQTVQTGHAFVSEHGSFTNFNVARNEARSVGGYITEQKIIGDFRR